MSTYKIVNTKMWTNKKLTFNLLLDDVVVLKGKTHLDCMKKALHEGKESDNIICAGGFSKSIKKRRAFSIVNGGSYQENHTK